MNKEINFKYVDYDENIIDCIQRDTDKKEIVVFSNYNLKKAYLYTLQKDLSIFDERPLIFEYNDFIKGLFPTDRVILKEITKLITLYNIFPKGLKEKNKIKNYNDFVSYGADFFNFFSNKMNCLVDNFKELQPWQKEKVKEFEELKKEYESYLDKKRFIPIDWEKRIDNLKPFFSDNIDKISFVDIIEFTPLEKEILKKLAKNFEIEIILQCHKGDFNEESFKLKDLSFPKQLENINVYKVSEDLEVAINIVEDIQNRSQDVNTYKNIYVPNLEKNMLNKILPRQIISGANMSLGESSIFLFLQGQYELLITLEEKMHSAILLEVVEKQINLPIFKKHYEISEKDIKEFYQLIKDDFKYFSPELLTSGIYEKYRDSNISIILCKIYKEINGIKKLTQVKEFIEIFRKNYTNLKMIDLESPGVLDSILFAMSIAENADKIDPEIKLKSIFSEMPASGIFRIILDEMKGLEVSSLKSDINSVKGYVRGFNDFSNQFSSDIYIADANSEQLPGTLGGNSIFTEHQKEENGLKTKEHERLIEKYKFFKIIFSNRPIKIYYSEDESKGIKISPFLEEIVLEYNLEIKNPKISLRDSLALFKKGIKSELSLSKKEDLSSNFPKTIGDINLSPYSVKNFQECELRYYLENIMGISKEDESFEKNISAKFLGSFSHIVFERVAKIYEKNIINNGEFKIDGKKVEEIIKNIIREYRYKIPIHLNHYFDKIILESLKESLFKFYQMIENKYKGEKIIRFLPEKQNDKYKVFIKENNFEVKLFGRSDLIIETEKRKGIVDYKTGKKNEIQLDYYSILFFGHEGAADKFSYNIYEKNLEESTVKKDGSYHLTVDALKESVDIFIKNENYTLAEKKSICDYCEFLEICRRGSTKK